MDASGLVQYQVRRLPGKSLGFPPSDCGGKTTIIIINYPKHVPVTSEILFLQKLYILFNNVFMLQNLLALSNMMNYSVWTGSHGERDSAA